VTDNDEAISKYYSLHPTDFPLLLRLEVLQVLTPDETPDLVISLELGQESSNRRLLLTFTGVREAKIQQPSLSLFQISFLEISSIRESQWEDLSYKVRCEDDLISFLCRSFDTESL
jgi:hypothetical protein